MLRLPGARLLLARGDRAISRGDPAASGLRPVLPDTMPTAEPLAYLAEIALSLEDRARLHRYHAGLLTFQGQFSDLLFDRLLGEIETTRGDWVEAQAHLAAAEATARREELLPE